MALKEKQLTWLTVAWHEANRFDFKDDWNSVMDQLTGYKHAIAGQKCYSDKSVSKNEKIRVELQFLYNLALRRWIVAKD